MIGGTIRRRRLTQADHTTMVLGTAALFGACGILITWGSLLTHAACRFPPSWTGYWFHSGFPQLNITADSISLKGKCIENDGDKYLFEDKRDNCYRCIVIHEKHVNALQYKETFCDTPDTLENLCSRINGDAQLYSMFRAEESQAVGCPFHGTFTFSYNRGHGECRSPVSSVDSCTEESRLLLRYQACPDVQGTESTVEELVCLATWKEGSTRFLVGRLEHNLATSSEEKFRCFIYEDLEDDSGYQVAQSGDATCIGLFSPNEGSRIMRLNRASSPPALCEFPSWMTYASSWLTLDGKTSFVFDTSTNTTMNMTEIKRRTTLLHAVCTDRLRTTERQATIVVHATIGCDNGYMCLKFYRRRKHVLEVQKGTIAHSPEEACLPMYFDETSSEYTTLLTSFPEPGRCPYLGKYTILSLQRNIRKDRRELCKGFIGMNAGCDRHDLIEFQPHCPSQQRIQTYQCHGHWEENGTNYLITSLRGPKAKFCFIYVEVDNVLKFSSVQESCSRRIQPGVNGFMAFNITSQGDCNAPTVPSVSEASRPWELVAVLLLGLVLCHIR